MAEHHVKVHTEGLTLSRAALKVHVSGDGKALGQLAISKGGVRWRTRNARTSSLVSWERVAELLDGEVDDRARPRTRRGRKFGHLCPRCTWYSMEAQPEVVEGAPWEYTHQCGACGMGVIHEERWRSRRVANVEELWALLGVDNWDGFAGWVTEFTDDNVVVKHEGTSAHDGVTSVATRGQMGLIFEFPGDIRELIADLQSAEDNSREDWLQFTGEAARRLVPLSQVYDDDDAYDAMP